MIGKRLSHYRIEEKIGAGGMGVVYRAHDEQLDRDVAIKVLPSRSLADETTQKRFRREALSLARLNHPNVATVHEFGSQGGVDFLVTEYISGITMDARLAGGPLPAAEVFRLGLQLAQGLAAAHQQGIVHRDLKPGNLRLTRDGRLKILDFGLAQFMPQPSDLGLTVTVTKSQETTGTLPYMAPEQLRGEGADARCDVWAAGAVLYEMATGKRPFPQTNAPLLIDAILNRPFEPASRINLEVPPLLDEVIRKALAKDPSQRYQTGGELAVALELPVSTGTAPVFPSAPRKRAKQYLASALILIFLALASATYLFMHRKKDAGPAPTTASRRRSIAVLGFKNLSGNPEKSWLSTALSEMMTTELSQGDQLRTIPGESVAQMRMSLAIPDADSYSQQTLNRIRQNLGSDDVVVGSYLPLGNGVLRLDLRMQDAVAGETLATVSEKGNESEIDTLVGKAGAKLRAKLGIAALSDEQSAVVRTSLPSNPEAARLYAEGLQKLRLFDALAARDLLEKAVALDPGYAPTRSALAQAWATLGYDDKAKEQARRALELSAKSSGKFSREERLLIEGRAHEIVADPPAAIENYRALWQFFPDRVDYGLFLIRAQIRAGRGSDAESTLADVRKLAVSDADAARIDLSDGNIAMSQSDFKRQQSSADRAANRGRTVGASLLVAEALQLEAIACERMGQSDKAIQLAAQARELFSSAGYRQGAARTLLMTADVLFDQGDFEGARKKVEEALPVFQEIGAQKSIRASRERIGNILYQQGKLQEAKTYYDQAVRFDSNIHDPTNLASDYGNIANTLDGLGDLTGALKMQQQALAAFNELGDRRGSSATLNNLGNLSVEMGNPDAAKKYFDQALALAQEITYRGGQPYPMSGLGDVLVVRGDLAGARKQYEQALAICEVIKDEDFAAQIHTALAFVALQERRFSDGEALARQSAAVFDKTNSTSSSAWAHALLARNLLSAGNLAEARVAAGEAITRSRQAAGETPRFEATLADSRVQAKSGKAAEARQQLESMLATTHKHGYRLYELQARLALGEIGLWSGSATARSYLAALEKDARNQGAIFIANQADALRQSK